MRRSTRPRASPRRSALVLALASACSADEGEGDVVFTTHGEAYIEEHIPAADVEDGWTIRYTKFLVALGEVRVAVADGAVPSAEMPRARLFDLHLPGDKPVFSVRLPARAYRHVSYAIGPAREGIELAPGVSDADRAQMVGAGFSIYVEGSLAKDGVRKTFRWGFTTDTVYDGCSGMLSGRETDGVVVRSGGTDAVELTIHGDHLFYDDLQSSDARVRGEHIAAADADDDGEVTLEELAAVDLATIPAERGPFGTGTLSGVHDLRAFVFALSRTVGHFRGEGECFARLR